MGCNIKFTSTKFFTPVNDINQPNVFPSSKISLKQLYVGVIMLLIATSAEVICF